MAGFTVYQRTLMVPSIPRPNGVPARGLRSAALIAVLTPGLALALAVPASVSSDASGSDAVVRLIDRMALQREAAVGETHRYSIELRAGEYVELRVEQDGADLAAVVTAPDGRVLLETDNPCGVIGPEDVALTTSAAGTHVVSLKANEVAVAPRGRYEVRVEAVREPTSRDLLRAKAVQANADARRLFSKEPAVGVERFREGAAAWAELGDRRNQMWMEMAVGVALAQGLDRFTESMEWYRRGLAAARELGDEWAEARVRFNLAQSMRRLGQLDEAREHFDAALALHRAAGRAVAAARVLSALGTFLALAGEPQAGLDHLYDALHAFQAAGIARNEAITRSDIALTFLRLRDPEPALEQCRLALPAFAKEPAYRAKCIAASARAHLQLGDLARAREAYNEALAIYKTTGNRVAEADAFMSLGDLYLAEDDLQAARDMFVSALGIHRSRAYLLGEGLTQCRLGEVHRRRGDRAEARTAFEAALALAPASSTFVSECAEAGLGRTARDAADLETARAHAARALERTESMRARLVSHQTRAAALATQQSLYELLIDVLMRQHEREPARAHDVAAFEASERARARSLLELLTEGAIDVRRGADEELLVAERSLRRKLNSSAQEEAQALASGKEEHAKALGRELDALAAQLTEVEARIRRSSPRYASLTQPQPLDLADIQTRVLDGETQLLQYAFGESRSYLWVVSKSRLQSFQLPPREEIERVARRVHALLSSPAIASRPEADANLQELSRMVLAPAATALAGRRLLVVAPGGLQYVPFGALPIDLGRSRPLMADFEVVSAPSASVIATLRTERAQRNPPANAAVVFADAVFEPTDPRLTATARARSELRSIRTASGSGEAQDGLGRRLRGLAEVGRLGRLPFSRQEADVIAALAPRGRTWSATGFAASREAATSPRLGDYHLVHFATHGVVNARRPELSGVVLSLFDARGRRQDGFLRLHDIYNLRLGADLVVLSGCQTALGREIRGEGLIGLTRGFMYAGARAVVASLWQVDDESTAELMKRFYRAMLKDGRRPAEALRIAQLEMSRSRRWAAPFHWAGFVLQGEWK